MTQHVSVTRDIGYWFGGTSSFGTNPGVGCFEDKEILQQEIYIELLDMDRTVHTGSSCRAWTGPYKVGPYRRFSLLNDAESSALT
jgi:hypothetical protein